MNDFMSRCGELAQDGMRVRASAGSSSFRRKPTLEKLRQQIKDGKNPRDVKFVLVLEIVERFHGKDAAEGALQGFKNQFQKGAIPDDIPEVVIETENGEIGLALLLKNAGLCF